MGKLRIAGLIFLVCLAVGAAWALWLGLKVFAAIAGVALAIGIAVGVATRWGDLKRLAAPEDRSRLS